MDAFYFSLLPFKSFEEYTEFIMSEEGILTILNDVEPTEETVVKYLHKIDVSKKAKWMMIEFAHSPSSVIHKQLNLLEEVKPFYKK